MADDQASNKPKRTLSATLTPVSGTPAPAPAPQTPTAEQVATWQALDVGTRRQPLVPDAAPVLPTRPRRLDDGIRKPAPVADRTGRKHQGRRQLKANPLPGRLWRPGAGLVHLFFHLWRQHGLRFRRVHLFRRCQLRGEVYTAQINAQLRRHHRWRRHRGRDGELGRRRFGHWRRWRSR